MAPSKSRFPIRYWLAPYRKSCGQVSEKTRCISSPHFLVLFSACQAALPVRKPLHSDPLHIKPTLKWKRATAYTVYALLSSICAHESQKNQWCLMAAARQQVQVGPLPDSTRYLLLEQTSSSLDVTHSRWCVCFGNNCGTITQKSVIMRAATLGGHVNWSVRQHTFISALMCFWQFSVWVFKAQSDLKADE